MGLEEEISRLRRQNRRLKTVLLSFIALFVLMAGFAVASAVQANAQRMRAMDHARRARAEAEKALIEARAAQRRIDDATSGKE